MHLANIERMYYNKTRTYVCLRKEENDKQREEAGQGGRWRAKKSLPGKQIFR